jgi:hypothetical protein
VKEAAVTRILFAALASLVLATTTIETSQSTAQSTAAGFPPRLERYLTTAVKLTPDERKVLISGEPVTKLLEMDESKEVAVFGGVWINAPAGRYVEAVTDIENFQRGGGFKVTRRISSPPRPEDFAEMHVPEDDVADLQECRVGDCALKLGEQALQAFRKEVDWKAANPGAAVDAVMRRLAFQYVNGYLEGGNERLAVYRDSSRPTFVAREFREMIDEMPELTTYMPDVRRYLLGYPGVTLPGSTSFLYWQETEFGLKPTFRITHVTIREAPEGTLVASKMLYASHYFWTGLELKALIPDPSRGPGFWFVTVNRSRSDGLSGFTGSLLRGRVHSEVRNGAQAGLQTTKAKLEQAR